MSVRKLSALENADFLRRWFLPYFTRGLLHRWSPSLWLADPTHDDAKRLIPRFLLRDLVEQAYEFEMPEEEDVDVLTKLREELAKDGLPDLIEADVLGSRTLVLFDPCSIAYVLDNSPDPFGPAPAKLRSMAYFQPDSLIMSKGPSFAPRRELNENVLQTGTALHEHAKIFLEIVDAEIKRQLEIIDRQQKESAKSLTSLLPALNWAFMEPLVERIVLQVVLGKAASDRELSDMYRLLRHLEQLMMQANAAALLPQLDRNHPDTGLIVHALRNHHFESLYTGIAGYLEDPAAGSLLDMCPMDHGSQPAWLKYQVPQWFWAMKEGVGIHALGGLRMLASHEKDLARVMGEIRGKDLTVPKVLKDAQHLEKCVLETLRLVSSAPLLIRETVGFDEIPTKGGKQKVPVQPYTQFLILNAYCNRDRRNSKEADHFVPERWKDRQVDPAFGPPSNHFGNGRQVCPGADLAILMTKAVTAGLLEQEQLKRPIDALKVRSKAFRKDKTLPFAFDHFRIDRPLPEWKKPRPEKLEGLPDTEVEVDDNVRFDFVVVGSGAGGGPLAVKLAGAGWRVLLLEAGLDPKASPGSETKYRVPAFHPLASEDKDLRWDFRVDGKRNRYYPRGSALGGSTAVHALITMKVPDKDWDDIAAEVGDERWNARNMAPYLEEVLRREYASEASGWLNVQIPNLLDLLQGLTADPSLKDILVAAAGLTAQKTRPNLAKTARMTIGELLTLADSISPGIGRSLEAFGARVPPSKLAPLLLLARLLSRDVNEPGEDWLRENGLFFVPASTRGRVRDGTRDHIVRFLHENPGNRKNLFLKTEALVTRVILRNENGRIRAEGVEYLEGRGLYRADRDQWDVKHEKPKAKPKQVLAEQEVILCGGAFNTPQILMLSGIGPREELEKCVGYEKKPHVILEGVGKNLQDRLEFTVVNELKHELPILDKATFVPDAKDPVFEQWERARRGLYANNGIALGLVLRSRKITEDEPADLFIFGAPTDFRGYRRDYSKDLVSERNKFTWQILKARTGNRGAVTLKSEDATCPPEIDFRNFSASHEDPEKDLEALVEGVRYIRAIMESERVKRNVRREAWPACDGLELAQRIREKAWGHHACGTCKMGDKKNGGVVDSEFKVHGVQGLRIVDASIFPRIPGFFIALPIYMASEKAARVILKSVGVYSGR